MATTLTGEFETRRAAEMAVERLVQEHGLERTDIVVGAAGDHNTAGNVPSGADAEARGEPGDGEGAPALEGRIAVSVAIEDDGEADRVREAFREFGSRAVGRG